MSESHLNPGHNTSLGLELYLESSIARDDFQAISFLIISSPSKMDKKKKKNDVSMLFPWWMFMTKITLPSDVFHSFKLKQTWYNMLVHLAQVLQLPYVCEIIQGDVTIARSPLGPE